MARPKKGTEKDRPRHIGFRAAVWLHEALQRLAAERGQPASEVAHDVMEAGFRRYGIIAPEPLKRAKADSRRGKAAR